MKATPYISASEQAILDAQEAERERIRLLLLADDFRDRALYAMMWGVLEVRWEDELKKEIPIPKCIVINMLRQLSLYYTYNFCRLKKNQKILSKKI